MKNKTFHAVPPCFRLVYKFKRRIKQKMRKYCIYPVLFSLNEKAKINVANQPNTFNMFIWYKQLYDKSDSFFKEGKKVRNA